MHPRSRSCTLTVASMECCCDTTSLPAATVSADVQELSLQGSKELYGSGLRHLAAMTRLHTIDLQQCTRLDAGGLAFLACLPRLLTVNVAKCPRVQGTDFAHLRTLQEHEFLVVVGLEGRSLEAASECGFRVAVSPAACM
jgi:ABC-type transporter Mla MlaB component